jgi:hypothetical protein
VGPSDSLAAIFVFMSLSAAIVGVAHAWSKVRIAKLSHSDTVEKRLARLEVAIDDMTSELARVSEGQQMMTKLLAERSSEGSHAGR